jgi:hypothetical protein
MTFYDDDNIANGFSSSLEQQLSFGRCSVLKLGVTAKEGGRAREPHV